VIFNSGHVKRSAVISGQIGCIREDKKTGKSIIGIAGFKRGVIDAEADKTTFKFPFP